MENICNIKENVDIIRYEIGETCAKIGRNPDEVLLMGVSKTKTAQDVEAAIKAGITLFGENRVQELVQKADMFQKYNVPCHIIGNLQTNKVKYIADKVSMIHSVDSFKLAEEISKKFSELNKTANILIQVNVSGEESKFGITPDESIPLIATPDECRKYFYDLKKLSLDIAERHIPGISMEHLSMGMSGDYYEAILEGATLVRVGSALFN